jgi:hypothetical protein
MKTFEEFLNMQIEYVNEGKDKLIENSKRHLIYESIQRFRYEKYYEEELSEKMREAYPYANFIVRQEVKDLKFNYNLTYYHFFYEESGKPEQITVKIIEKDNKLLFIHHTKNKERTTNMFIEELKKLPEYRLILLTQ